MIRNATFVPDGGELPDANINASPRGCVVIRTRHALGSRVHSSTSVRYHVQLPLLTYRRGRRRGVGDRRWWTADGQRGRLSQHHLILDGGRVTHSSVGRGRRDADYITDGQEVGERAVCPASVS